MSELLLASAASEIVLWESKNFNLVQQLDPFSQNISAISWASDNIRLASTSDKSPAISLSVLKGSSVISKEITSATSAPAGRKCVAFNSGSRYVVTGNTNNIVDVFDLKSCQLRKSYDVHNAPVNCVLFNHNNQIIASASNNGNVIVHNIESGKSSRPLTMPRIRAIREIQFSPFVRNHLSTLSDDGTLNLWDTSSFLLIHSFHKVNPSPTMGLVMSPVNESLMVTVGLDKMISFYDNSSYQFIRSVTTEYPLTSVDMFHDGCTLAIGTTRGAVLIYDLRMAKTPVCTPSAHITSVRSVKFQLPHVSNRNTSDCSLKLSSQSSLSGRIDSDADLKHSSITDSFILPSAYYTKYSTSQMYSPLSDVFSPIYNGAISPLNRVGSSLSDVSNSSHIGVSPLVSLGKIERRGSKTFTKLADTSDQKLSGTTNFFQNISIDALKTRPDVSQSSLFAISPAVGDTWDTTETDQPCHSCPNVSESLSSQLFSDKSGGDCSETNKDTLTYSYNRNLERDLVSITNNDPPISSTRVTESDTNSSDRSEVVKVHFSDTAGVTSVVETDSVNLQKTDDKLITRHSGHCSTTTQCSNSVVNVKSITNFNDLTSSSVPVQNGNIILQSDHLHSDAPDNKPPDCTVVKRLQQQIAMMEDKMEDIRDEMRQYSLGLFGSFVSLLDEQTRLLEARITQCSLNHDLVAENEQLRAEISRLKCNF